MGSWRSAQLLFRECSWHRKTLLKTTWKKGISEKCCETRVCELWQSSTWQSNTSNGSETRVKLTWPLVSRLPRKKKIHHLWQKKITECKKMVHFKSISKYWVKYNTFLKLLTFKTQYEIMETYKLNIHRAHVSSSSVKESEPLNGWCVTSWSPVTRVWQREHLPAAKARVVIITISLTTPEEWRAYLNLPK